jgi:hypothetical protein
LRRLRRGEDLEWERMLWLFVLPVAAVDIMVYPGKKSFYDSSGFLDFSAEQLL